MPGEGAGADLAALEAKIRELQAERADATAAAVAALGKAKAEALKYKAANKALKELNQAVTADLSSGDSAHVHDAFPARLAQLLAC